MPGLFAKICLDLFEHDVHLRVGIVPWFRLFVALSPLTLLLCRLCLLSFFSVCFGHLSFRGRGRNSSYWPLLFFLARFFLLPALFHLPSRCLVYDSPSVQMHLFSL